MDKPSVSEELDDKLDPQVTALKKAFRDGRCDEGLALADEIWQELPEPRSGWDYYSQIVPLRAANGAIECGALDRAAEWLERAYEGYAPQDDASQQMLDFVKAKLMFRAGHKDIAYAYFNASYDALGRRAFEDEPEAYWDFFEHARKSGEFTGTPAPVAAGGDVVPPIGSGTVAPGAELPDDLHNRIVALYEEGSNYEDLGAPQEAARCLADAARLLPEPRTAWDAATLIYTALGDALISMTQYDEALDALNIALQSPGGTGNGYVWLRLGQARQALGQEHEALEAYTSAYMLEGKELFDGEDRAWATLEAAGIPNE